MGLLDAIGGLFTGGESAVGEEFVGEAEDLADQWADEGLDFTPASLARLDAAVADRWRGDRFEGAAFGGDDEVSRAFSGLVVKLGAYAGEVLVRNLDATWVEDEEFGAAVRVHGDVDDAVVNVFHLAAEGLRGDPQFEATYQRVAGAG